MDAWPLQFMRGGLRLPACPPAPLELRMRIHTSGPSSVLLQAAHFIRPGGSTSSSSGSTAPACAALLLVREEAQLRDLASELETLRAQLNQASGKGN